MRKILKIGWSALLLIIGYSQLSAQEQDIRISDFKCVITDLTGSTRPRYDNAGEACATILFDVRDTTFVVEGNLGIIGEPEKTAYDIRIWVPRGTRRLTVKHVGLFPLRGYEIPVRLEPKMSYHARLWSTKTPIVEVEEPVDGKNPVIETPVKKEERKDWRTHGYVGIGFDALSILGPSLSLGLDVNHHTIELSALYGVNKTDALYLYSGDNLKAGYRYRASRASLRYGYDIRTGKMGFMPQVGVAANLFTLEPLQEAGMDTNDYRYTYSISAIAALRLSVDIGSNMKLHVTPEYDFGAYKSNHLKLVSEYDDDLKKWTEGFGLNAGLIFVF